MKTSFKRIFCFLPALILAWGAYAQTAEEILDRVNVQMNGSAEDGLYMVMDMKLPLLGTYSAAAYSLGDKMRIEMNRDGKRSVSYIDGQTRWEYESEKNTVTIKTVVKDSTASSPENNLEMLRGITDGYRAQIRKETDEAWYIRCTKTRDNKDKNDPRHMDLVVLKPDCRLKSMTAKASFITITMRDFATGVPESKVTFDSAEFPGAAIIDTR